MRIPIGYVIFEFKTEEELWYDTIEDAQENFDKIKELNKPGIWQLINADTHEYLDEFIGG